MGDLQLWGSRWDASPCHQQKWGNCKYSLLSWHSRDSPWSWNLCMQWSKSHGLAGELVLTSSYQLFSSSMCQSPNILWFCANERPLYFTPPSFQYKNRWQHEWLHISLQHYCSYSPCRGVLLDSTVACTGMWSPLPARKEPVYSYRSTSLSLPSYVVTAKRAGAKRAGILLSYSAV